MSLNITCELENFIKKLEDHAGRMHDPRQRAVFGHGLRNIRAQLEEIDRDVNYLVYIVDKAAAEAEAD